MGAEVGQRKPTWWTPEPEREVSVSLEEMAAGDWGPPEVIKLGIQSKLA